MLASPAEARNLRHETPSEGALSLAQESTSLARELKSRVLLRAVFELGPVDPIDAFAPALRQNEGMLWSDGRTGTVVAARGVKRQMRVSQHATASAASFLDRERRALVQGWYGSGQPSLTELPLALGAFSFHDGQPEARDPWSGWATHSLTIPDEMLIRWAGTPTMAVLALNVDPGDDPDLIAQRLAERRARMKLAVHNTPPRIAQHANDAARIHAESRDSWCQRIEEVKAAFANDGLEKVVLARRTHFRVPQGHVFDAVATVARLRHDHPDAFVFAVTQGDNRWFVGATPELLARVSSGRFDGHALAGTIANSDHPDEDRALADELRTSVKNQHEHAVVTRAIENTLQRHCDRVEVADVPTVRRLTELQHLETSIRGRVRSETALLDIVADLHPTPAVGGFPQLEATRFLGDHENLHRGYYASPVGWIGVRGEGAFAVALRCALLSEHEAVAFVGAGIVADSMPEAEWDETELKLRTIAQALAIRRNAP